MPNLNFGPVDYTSRDYASLRDDIIAAVKERLPGWSGSDDPNDYLRAILEAFAYVSDVTNYYVDRAANEAYLPTATNRQSLLNIARTFGYNPAGPIAAAVDLTLSNSAGSAAVLPAGTSFIGVYNRNGAPIQVYFETDTEVTVPANGSATVGSTEGATRKGSNLTQTNGDPIGVLLYKTDGTSVSDGTLDQVFVIPEGPIVEGSIEIWVHPPTGTPTVADGVRYEEFTHLIDAGPSDRAFLVQRNANDSANIIFGDGASGFIPESGYQVRAVYRTGQGEAGNVAPNTINTVGLKPDGTAVPVTISVSHADNAVGGTDTESNDVIRNKAARALRTSNRAVTLQDFEDFSIQAAGVSQAKALGSSMSNVVVYVAPFVSSDDAQPGYVEINGDITNIALGSTVATITTAAPHGLATGQTINVFGLPFPLYGTWSVVSVPTTTTFTFTCPSTRTIASTAATGNFTAIGTESASFTDLRNDAKDALAQAVPMGTGVAVAGPSYVDLKVNLTINLSANVRQSTTRNLVTSAVLQVLSVDDQAFGAQVYTSDVIGAAVSVAGVASAQVTTFNLAKTYSDGAATIDSAVYESAQDTLIAAPYEIFRLLPQNLTLTVIGGIADLS